MDKEVLKSVLGALKVEDVVELNFVTNFRDLNGKYKILKLGTGKGKNGSLIMELMNMDTGNKLNSLNGVTGKTHSMGTPSSEYIINMTVGDKFYGSKNESESPKAFPKDKEAADALREILRPYLKRTTETKLTITSEKAPEFNGTWLVKNAKLNAGRHGQISLQLVDVSDPNRMIELWSYRHGAIIDSIEELS